MNVRFIPIILLNHLYVIEIMSSNNLYKMVVEAGPDGESSSFYRYVASSTPGYNKSVDDPIYHKLISLALDSAQKVVEITNKKINLEFSVEIK